MGASDHSSVRRGRIESITWFPFYQDGGRPGEFTAQIVEVALSPPNPRIGMTELPKLRACLIEQNIVASISIEHLRRLLRQRGVRWRCTKTWKESNDPDFDREYRAIRRLYDDPPPGGRVICVDEFGPLNLQPRHGTCLAGANKRVERHRASCKRRLGVRHFPAYYDLKTDRLCGYVSRSKETPDFLRWVRRG